MGFWKSEMRTARKEHKCLYCGKIILPKERYSRETGVFEGDFNDYCLDEVCRLAVDMFYRDGEELGNLFDNLSDNDYLNCPDCGSIQSEYKRDNPFSHKYSCTCRRCKKEWKIEITKDFLEK